jgi:hypothetical protein
MNILNTLHSGWQYRYNNQGTQLTARSLNDGKKNRLFSSLKFSGRLWGPISLLVNGYQGPFYGLKAAVDEKLTSHLHLMPGLQ